MNNLRVYPFFSDPGHGWLKVPMNDVRALGIAGEISHYSYRDGDNAYLEEDCDLSRFMHAAKAAGWNVDIEERKPANNSSRIRSYNRFTA